MPAPCNAVIDRSKARIRVDVVVAGAGIAGAAIAFQLTRRSLSVAVVERGGCAATGATAASGGIVRVYDRLPRLAELARAGVAYWNEWSLGRPIPYERCGVVQLLPEARVDGALQLAREFGSADYPIEVLSRRDAACRFPWLQGTRGEPFVLLHEPRGGFCNPRLAAQLCLDAARRQGALVLERIALREIDEQEDEVAVELDDARICAKAVVVACGAWSTRWLRNAPLTPRRIQLTMVAGHPGLNGPCIIDDVSDAYLGRCHGGLAFAGSGNPPDLPDADAATPVCERRRARHLRFVAALTGEPPILLGDVVGVDAYTPDLLPLVGFAQDGSRLFRFTGFSGRGAKYIPALAATAADDIAQRLRE
jgi:glycine/D-amino acid oxidase-like deaminating enzyme